MKKFATVLLILGALMTVSSVVMLLLPGRDLNDLPEKGLHSGMLVDMEVSLIEPQTIAENGDGATVSQPVTFIIDCVNPETNQVEGFFLRETRSLTKYDDYQAMHNRKMALKSGESSMDELRARSLRMKGVLARASKTSIMKAKELLRGAGYSKEEIEAMLQPYVIRDVSIYHVLVLVGIMLAVVGLILRKHCYAKIRKSENDL